MFISIKKIIKKIYQVISAFSPFLRGHDYYLELTEDQKFFLSAMRMGFVYNLFGWNWDGAGLSEEKVEAIIKKVKRRVVRDQFFDEIKFMLFGERSDLSLYISRQIVNQDIRFFGEESVDGENFTWLKFRNRYGEEFKIPGIKGVIPFPGRKNVKK